MAAGGIPIGSVLVCTVHSKIIGRGHNQRVQHAEMNGIENAGLLPASVHARSTLYSTLSPHPMCSGAALLYKSPRIVVGENVTFQAPEDYAALRACSWRYCRTKCASSSCATSSPPSPSCGMKISGSTVWGQCAGAARDLTADSRQALLIERQCVWPGRSECSPGLTPIFPTTLQNPGVHEPGAGHAHRAKQRRHDRARNAFPMEYDMHPPPSILDDRLP